MNYLIFLWKYLVCRWKLLLSFGVFVLIFLMVFSLSKLPTAPVAYAFLLSSVVGILFLFVGSILEYIQLGKILYDSQTPPTFMDPTRQRLYAEWKKLQNLLNEREHQFEEEIQKANEYYTMWVHQVKTPISSMRVNLSGVDTPLARQQLSEINRIEQYVDMVLAYMRVNAPSTDYVIRAFDLGELLSQSIKRFSGEFIGRGIALEFEQMNEVVLTDDKWFRFVFEQLLSNALKYTRKGKISVSVEDVEGEDACELVIKDTGIGIRSEDLSRIFQRGYTGFNGRTDMRATGIGLSLSKTILDRLGHEISVQSTVGVGTEFRISLPLASRLTKMKD